jgi:hypothetical protein
MDQIEHNLSRIRNALRQRAVQATEAEPIADFNEPIATGSGVFFGGVRDRNGTIERDDLIVASPGEIDSTYSVTELASPVEGAEADVWGLIRRRLGLGR